MTETIPRGRVRDIPKPSPISKPDIYKDLDQKIVDAKEALRSIENVFKLEYNARINKMQEMEAFAKDLENKAQKSNTLAEIKLKELRDQKETFEIEKDDLLQDLKDREAALEKKSLVVTSDRTNVNVKVQACERKDIEYKSILLEVESREKEVNSIKDSLEEMAVSLNDQKNKITEEKEAVREEREFNFIKSKKLGDEIGKYNDLLIKTELVREDLKTAIQGLEKQQDEINLEKQEFAKVLESHKDIEFRALFREKKLNQQAEEQEAEKKNIISMRKDLNKLRDEALA